MTPPFRARGNTSREAAPGSAGIVLLRIHIFDRSEVTVSDGLPGYWYFAARLSSFSRSFSAGFHGVPG